MSERPKRLHRSRSDRKLAGVLGGVAEYLGLDPSLVRLVYLIVTILTGFVPGIFLYVAMAIIIPLEPKGGGEQESA
ncbi:MAG: PspC domain-containing protein [Dehalococcoidia bacterium]|nr:PspC domain-containing protein [Dehalococcoidia bacterium]